MSLFVIKLITFYEVNDLNILIKKPEQKNYNECYDEKKNMFPLNLMVFQELAMIGGLGNSLIQVTFFFPHA
jgi:hypothetical protein